MSADISRNAAGQAEVFVAGAPAWHHLGVNVKEAQTWGKASKLAGLDWTISKNQLVNPRTGLPIPSYALLRDDDNRWIHTVGEGYNPIQNKDTFTFVDALLESGDAHYESAGALGNGEIVWCLARLKKDFSPVAGDAHHTYLLFAEFRDGRAAQVKLTMTRVVCQNTLNVALSQRKIGDNVLRIRHSGDIDTKIKAAKSLVSNVNGDITKINNKLAELAKKQITVSSFSIVMEKLFPGWEKGGRAQNKAAAVAMNFENNDGGNIPKIAGTAYSLLQSVTKFIDHQRDGLRTGGKAEDLPRARAESAMFGTGDVFKSEALDRICEAVGVSTFSEDEQRVDKIAGMVAF